MSVYSTRVVQDRRGVLRVTLMVPCQIEWDGESSKAVLNDISLKGAFLRTRRLIPPGSVIRITWRMSDSRDPFQVEAQVVKASGDWKFQRRLGGFPVRLLKTGPEILSLITLLTKRRRAY